MKKLTGFGLALLVVFSSYGQVSKTYSSADILQQMKKLKVLGSVLYMAAHPDDENTRLIAWLANIKQYRTGYLSLTRGDGGQNLIGDEQGIELGLIRSQELLAARRIDGGEQFFTSAFDFGFSKSPKEAFDKWDHEKVLGDAVWVVRRFQPDVIIARFPEDGRAGHGHHSASGIIAREVFEAAADPNRFTEQFQFGVKPWRVKRVLWNTFNFGRASTIDSSQFSVEVGDYNALLGQSMGELAGESRSQHKSQGFGVSRQRGSAREFFVPVQGDKPTQALLDGVETTWARVKDGKEIEQLVDAMIANFKTEQPSASIPYLRSIIGKVQGMENLVWREVKMKELQELMLRCAGIYVEATLPVASICSGDTANINLYAISRSDVPVRLLNVHAGTAAKAMNVTLENNRPFVQSIATVMQGGVMQTQPYWLRKMPANGRYVIEDQNLVGKPENDPVSATVQLWIDSVYVTVQQPLQYRYVDPVKAEQYQPVYFTDRYLLFNSPGILLFKKGTSDSASLQVNITGTTAAIAPSPRISLVSENLPYQQQVKRNAIQWSGGDVFSYNMKVPNYLKGTNKETDVLSLKFMPDTNAADTFYNAKRSIVYDHIPTQTWHYQDQVKVLHIDLKTEGRRIGYLNGAGDKVAASLVQMGYQVTELKAEDLTFAKLKSFDAIITGVRAYNVHDFLADAYPALMQYVKEGGNLIVQYNTSNFISALKSKLAPYPFSISRNRITDENAAVEMLLPAHPALNFPNKITTKDFEGWVQERSIYHAEANVEGPWQYPIAMADPGEEADKGALAIAAYGKGNFVYTGLVFFRELPAGVPGAYRLLANLIALPRH